jgi:hypothetical protein
MDENTTRAHVDENELRQALQVLHAQFGNRLPGDMIDGEVRMRRALLAQLNVDEPTADRLVKQLAHTGWITFRGAGTEDDTNILTPSGTGGRISSDVDRPDAWQADATDLGARPAGVPAEPFIAGAALTGLQTGSGQQAGAGGGAIAGAAAAGLVGSQAVSRTETTGGRGAGDNVTGADIPDTNQDAINSAKADANPSDPRGYWLIGDMPGTTSANV